MAAGCLLVMMQPPPEIDGEFNDWYDSDHIPERLAISGFLAARRYECADGWPRYLALYDLADPNVLVSPEYLAVAEGNYTSWTRRVLSRVRVMRHPLVQKAPGSALTSTAPRLLVVRLASVGDASVDELFRRLDKLRRHNAEIDQVRLMLEPSTNSMYTMIEMRSPLAEGIITASTFCPYNSAIDLWNVYVACSHRAIGPGTGQK